MNNSEMRVLAEKLEKLLNEDKIEFSYVGKTQNGMDEWRCRVPGSNFVFVMYEKSEIILYLLSDPNEKIKTVTPQCACGVSLSKAIKGRIGREVVARNTAKIKQVTELLDKL